MIIKNTFKYTAVVVLAAMLLNACNDKPTKSSSNLGSSLSSSISSLKKKNNLSEKETSRPSEIQRKTNAKQMILLGMTK